MDESIKLAYATRPNGGKGIHRNFTYRRRGNLQVYILPHFVFFERTFWCTVVLVSYSFLVCAFSEFLDWEAREILNHASRNITCNINQFRCDFVSSKRDIENRSLAMISERLSFLRSFVSVNKSIWSSIFAFSFKLLMIFSFMSRNSLLGRIILDCMSQSLTSEWKQCLKCLGKNILNLKQKNN